MIKFYFLTSIFICSIFSFGQYSGIPKQIETYQNNQANTLNVKVAYGNAKINTINLSDLNNKIIYHIDYVYSKYTGQENFNQLKLNEKRLKNLKKQIPQIDLDHPKWTYFEQTLAKNKKEAKALFHGFVIHYGNKIDYKSQSEHFGKIQKPFSVIDINNQTGGRVEYYTGSSIVIEKLAVTYHNGDTVIGNYQLYYREFRNSAEIATSGIPMTYAENQKNEIFNSVGMYEIIAKKEGKDLILVKDVTVNFQCTQILDNVSFYQLDSEDNWQHENSVNFNVNSDSTSTNNIGGSYFVSGELLDKNVTLTSYRPEKYIDQGSFQGYSRIKELTTIDKNQMFAKLSHSSWTKFKRLYNKSNSTVKPMTLELNEQQQTLLVYQADVKQFLEIIIGQKYENLEVEKLPNKAFKYSCSGNNSNGLTNIVGDDPIPPSPGLVMGLKSPNFGVYNCDQTRRIEEPLVLSPTYFDKKTGEKIKKLYVACVIDLNLNASLSYHPNHLVCNSAGNSKVLLFTSDNHIYLINENEFKNADIDNINVALKMDDITTQVNNCDDLKLILGV